MAWTTPGTAVAGDVLTASFWNSNVRDNLTVLAPFASAWTSWTPAFTPSGWTTSGGAASFSGKYIQVGKTVMFYARIIMGSSITAGSYMTLTLPVNATSVGALSGITVMARDYGTNWFPLFVAPGDSAVNYLTVYAGNASATYLGGAIITGTVPFTWVQNDEVTYGGIYEAA